MARGTSLLLLCLTASQLPAATLAGMHLGESLLREVGHAPCVRLFSSQGTTGCRTPSHAGTTAPLYYLQDLASPAMQAFQALGQGVAVVMPMALFNATVMEFLAAQTPARTQGVIVVEEDDAAGDNFAAASPDVPTPQGQGTPSAALTLGPGRAWNPLGNGLALEAYDFPVVLATGTEGAQVQAWARHNGGLGKDGPFPRYKAVFDFYFGPASSSTPMPGDLDNSTSPHPVTSSDCLTWRDLAGTVTPQCMPMGGQSVWASVGGRTGLQTKPTVLLTAAMDGASLFHDRTPAANEAVSSLVAVLAAISALVNASVTNAIDLAAAPNNVAVAFFQADEWGFAGSRRFVQDIGRAGFACASPVPGNLTRDGSGACVAPSGVHPSLAFQDLALDDLVHVLAVDQVGVLNPGGVSTVPLTAHFNGDTPTALLDALAAATTSLGTGVASVTPLDGGGALPPTPLTSFLRAAPELSGAVLAGYGAAFIDPRYHSHQDNATFVNLAALPTAATLLARTAWTLASGDDAAAASPAALAAIQVEQGFVDMLFACLTEDWDCPAMKPFREAESANLKEYLGRSYVYTPPVPHPPNFYSGVLASYQGLPLAMHVDPTSSDSDVVAAWPADGPAFVASPEDKFYVVPKPLEAFLRGWLAYTLGHAEAVVTCVGPKDCEGQTCDGGLSTRECIHGACICRTAAFYHTALDPGVGPLAAPDTFTVLSSDTPNWAEPNWADIGLAVYPDTSPHMEATALGLGLGMAGLSVLGALWVQRVLVKQHFFD